MEQDGSRCPVCRAPVAASSVICGACGTPLLDAGTLRWARGLTAELAAALGRAPYFRGLAGLGYTFRGQVRGFLEDPSHPLARALLRYLWLLSVEGGAAGLRHLARLATTTWLLPGTPVVAAAVAYLRHRYRRELRAAAAGDDAVRIRALRGAVQRGDASEDELTDLRAAAFTRWYEALVAARSAGDASPSHSM